VVVVVVVVVVVPRSSGLYGGRGDPTSLKSGQPRGKSVVQVKYKKTVTEC
jgi:hypothetical protein